MDLLRSLLGWRVWLIAIWFCSLISTGSSLSCFICNSTLDPNCQENFNPNSVMAKEKYKECFMWDAQYCIKITGLWGGIVGAHRFCSSKDLGDQCQDIWFPDHDRMYRACVYTCSGDGCNGASLLSVSASAVMSTFVVVTAVVRTLL
ncbi:U-scoloptoxin(05)-Sm1a-like [Gigantopelta aegis]|uniref:U-scoloptoxin(05)-Sm1a-like n=1 Tax=Gigantopelta aegis TaxID=1735272 RepID=UPI001B88D824|nr:U-scoloptoxin(05)-Sm1a-like [Gigantopelta aegis]